MGAGASSQLVRELERPLDASDVTSAEEAKAEVQRLRKLFAQEAHKDKIATAAMGALVGNASCMPTEWFYLDENLKKLVGDEDILFFKTPSCVFFSGGERSDEEYAKLAELQPNYGLTNEQSSFDGRYQLGDLCPTGEVLFDLLPLVSALPHDAELDGMVIAKMYYDWQLQYTGRLNHSQQDFAKNMSGDLEFAKKTLGKDDATEEEIQAEATKKQTTFPFMGADNTMAECYVRVILAMLRYGSDPAGPSDLFFKNLETMVRALQNCAESKAVLTAIFMSRVLFGVLAGQSTDDAFNAACDAHKDNAMITAAVDFVKANREKDCYEAINLYGASVCANEAYKKFVGRGCMGPHAMICSLFLVLKGNDYETTMRENAWVGGDSSQRAIIIGAICAARDGAVPAALESKFTHAKAARKLIMAAIP
jgi:ADP-ribosylglycohydrolase